MELDELLKLIRAVSDSELTGFKYEAEGVCLNLKKEKEVVTAVQTLPAAGVSQSVMPMQAAAASAMSEASADSEEKAAGTKEAEQKGFLVKSPLVGTFYAAPAEDAAPYVAVGDTVKKGQVIIILEAMKMENNINADKDGKITAINVSKGDSVLEGNDLVIIE